VLSFEQRRLFNLMWKKEWLKITRNNKVRFKVKKTSQVNWFTKYLVLLVSILMSFLKSWTPNWIHCASQITLCDQLRLRKYLSKLEKTLENLNNSMTAPADVSLLWT